MSRSLNIVYFSWVRERLGLDHEQLSLDAGIDTIADVLAVLARRGEGHAEIFADVDKLRFALDQDYSRPDSPVGSAGELAIFPPVTGG